MAGWMLAPTLGSPLAGTRLADRFDLLWGLPVHPMAVSIAVVLLPVSSLLLVAIVLIPKLRRALGWFVMILLAGSVGIAYLAQQSGAALAVRLGRPEDHADLATLVLWFTVVQFAAGFVWFLTMRIRQGRAKKGSAKKGSAKKGSAKKGSDAGAPASRLPAVDPYGGATGGVDPLTGLPFGASDPQTAATIATPKPASSPVTVVLGMFAVLVAALNLFLAWRVAESGMRATWEARVAGTSAAPSTTPSEITPSPVSPSVISPSDTSPRDTSPSVISPSDTSPSDTSPSGVLPSPVAPVPPSAVSPGAVRNNPSLPATASYPAPTTESLGPRSLPDEVPDTPYTRGDVAAHSRVESCWIIVGTRVYDMTGWLPIHPDSADTIAELCGTDTSGVITNQTWESLISPRELARLQIGVLE